MLYVFYPKENIHINESQLIKDMQYIEYKDEGGYVSAEINALYKKKKYRWLYLKVVDFLDKIAEEDDLSSYFSLDLLEGIGDGLIEMRIPKADKRGVFRINYCNSELVRERDVLVLLEAEYKHGDPMKIESARKRKREYIAKTKKEKKNGKN